MVMVKYCCWELYTITIDNITQPTIMLLQAFCLCSHQASIRMCLAVCIASSHLMITSLLQVANKLDASCLSRILSTSLTQVVSTMMQLDEANRLSATW